MNQRDVGIHNSCRLVNAALGQLLREARKVGCLSQEEIADELTEFGLAIGQARVSNTEQGIGAPLPELAAEVWLKRCGVGLNSDLGRRTLEYRELCDWFWQMQDLVPRGIPDSDFGTMAAQIADLSLREIGDIRSNRRFLKRAIGNFLCHQARERNTP